MRLAADHADVLASVRPAVVYTDLDGTLFGPGGALLAGSDGAISEAASRALARLHRAGIAVVPVSGRTEDQVREAGRVIGASGFIAELGGIIDTGEGVIRRYGEHLGPGTPFEAMARSGAAGFLLDAFGPHLEPHAPWAFRGRECTMLFRGHLDPAEASRALEDAGYRWLSLQDNGRITSRGSDPLHAYHLAPVGVTKREAVGEDLRRRGLTRDDAIAVGDGPSDAEMGLEVGASFIVANGVEAVTEAGAETGDTYATSGARGEGFAEAIGLVLGDG